MKFDDFIMAALASAYPSWDELDGVVQAVLEVRLNEATSQQKAMPAVRLELLGWLKECGVFAKFLRGARRRKPDNYLLRNAVWLYDLLPLLHGREEWRPHAEELWRERRFSRTALKRVPTRQETENFAPEDFATAVSYEEDWRGDHVPHVPLLEFVHLLSTSVAKFSESAAAALRPWLDAAVDSLDWEQSQVERLRFGWKAESARRAAVPSMDMNPPRLQVRVRVPQPPNDKDAAGEDVYELKAWLVAPEVGGPLLDGVERRVRKDELGGLVNECRRELGLAGLRPDQVRLELTLPRALLSEAIDQWPDPEDDTPIGSLHVLVLRSWERLERPDWSAEVGKHLETFRDRNRKVIPVWNADGATGGDAEAIWIDAGQPGGSDLRLKLKGRAGCCVCVLETGPQPAPRDPKTDVLYTLLRSGVPIIIWARQPPELSDQLQTAFETLLAASLNLSALPEAICRHRFNAASCPEPPWQLGKQIAVIWDDPQYAPSPEKDYTFRSPNT